MQIVKNWGRSDIVFIDICDMSLFFTQQPRPLLNPPYQAGIYAPFDLRGVEPNLVSEYLHQCFSKTGASVLFGGYLEKRRLYQKFNHFEHESKPVRNVHLGVDFWTSAGTPVYCPYPGKVHSFDHRTIPGDYGPVIILEHEFGGSRLYTLYGHLSAQSLIGLDAGLMFSEGEKIADLGEPHENGGYAPHLHFQLIRDIGNWSGDYPGVSAHADLEFFRENCPNPLEFLGYR